MIGREDRLVGKGPLYDMFAAVPARYDLLNRILTWGLDQRWRRQAAKECLCAGPKRMLDLCSGTGDLAINLARLVTPDVELEAVDFCRPMLKLAMVKAERLTPGKRLSFIQGDAASLPFPDGYFDCVGVSFAFRNLTYRNPLRRRYMSEVLRLLRPGGRCVILETSQPRSKPLRAIYHRYLHSAVPWLGGLLSGKRGAYRYLAESAARFYSFEEIGQLLIAAGFRQVSFRPLFFGVAGIHVAVK